MRWEWWKSLFYCAVQRRWALDSRGHGGGRRWLVSERRHLPATVPTQRLHCRVHTESSLAFQQTQGRQERELPQKKKEKENSTIFTENYLKWDYSLNIVCKVAPFKQLLFTKNISVLCNTHKKVWNAGP